MTKRWPSKEYRELAERAAGGTVRATSKHHMRVTRPEGSVTAGATVSNRRNGGRGWPTADAQVKTRTGWDLGRRVG